MTTETDVTPMGTRIQLSAMMFLQYMMIAVWWVPLAAYLKQVGIDGTSYFALILSTMALGCLTSPLVGMIADRHFAGQKVLFALNLVGGILLVVAAYVTSPLLLFIVLLVHMLCYMPTWGLTSAIAMAHAPSEKFAQIRVFGSIGWVLAAVFSVVAVNVFGVAKEGFDTTSLPMLCGAGVGIAGAFLALTLPNTPPPAKGKKASIIDALGLRALSLMSDFYFALYIVLAMLVMIPFAAYFNFGSAFLNDKGFKYLTLTMNLGQFAEMFFMLLVPIVLAKCGIRWTLIFGLIALTIRYAAFLFGDMGDITALYFVAVLVHGLIFGFFFVGGQVYVDKKAPENLRAQAQGMMFLMTFGLGTIIGNYVTDWLLTTNKTPDGVTNWIPVWMAMTVASAVMTVAFFLLFHDKIAEKKDSEGEAEPAAAE